jgi:hypothetical protein
MTTQFIKTQGVEKVVGLQSVTSEIEKAYDVTPSAAFKRLLLQHARVFLYKFGDRPNYEDVGFDFNKDESLIRSIPESTGIEFDPENRAYLAILGWPEASIAPNIGNHRFNSYRPNKKEMQKFAKYLYINEDKLAELESIDYGSAEYFAKLNNIYFELNSWFKGDFVSDFIYLYINEEINEKTRSGEFFEKYLGVENVEPEKLLRLKKLINVSLLNNLIDMVVPTIVEPDVKGDITKDSRRMPLIRVLTYIERAVLHELGYRNLGNSDIVRALIYELKAGTITDELLFRVRQNKLNLNTHNERDIYPIANKAITQLKKKKDEYFDKTGVNNLLNGPFLLPGCKLYYSFEPDYLLLGDEIVWNLSANKKRLEGAERVIYIEELRERQRKYLDSGMTLEDFVCELDF